MAVLEISRFGPIFGILVLLSPLPSFAESISLTNGRTLDGKVLSVTGSKVTIETQGGKITLSRRLVVTPDLAKVLEAAKSLATESDFAGVADRCRQILAWDPNHSEALDLSDRAGNFLRLFGPGGLGKPQSPPVTKKNPRTFASPRLRKKQALVGKELRELLLMIMERLTDVKEYSHMEEVVRKRGLRNGVLQESVHREERCFKRPFFFSGELVQTRHFLPEWVGRKIHSRMDGNFLWRYLPAATASPGKTAAEAPAGEDGNKESVPPGPSQGPSLQKWDLVRLRRAGFRAENIVQAGKLLNPFGVCDVATIRLENQDDSKWVFSSRPNPAMRKQGMRHVRLTIDKKDCIARKIEWFGPNKNVGETYLISRVRLNPGHPDGRYAFSPPPGVEITDETEALLGNRQTANKP